MIGEIYNVFFGTEVEAGERKGGRPLLYLSSTIKFHILTASKWPEHHRLFLSSSSPWFLSNVRRGRDNTERGKKKFKHSTFSDPPSAAFDRISQILVVPSGERERVGGIFSGYTKKRYGLCYYLEFEISMWNRGLKGGEIFQWGGYRNHLWMLTCSAVLFCCFLVLHSLDNKFVVTSLR